jgi:hypothetical protein
VRSSGTVGSDEERRIQSSVDESNITSSGAYTSGETISTGAATPPNASQASAYLSEIRPSHNNQLIERVGARNYNRYLIKVILSGVWQALGLVYQAHQQRVDDARPKSVLQVPIRLVGEADCARVLSYRAERST